MKAIILLAVVAVAFADFVPQSVVLPEAPEPFVAEEEPFQYSPISIEPMIIPADVMKAYENEAVDAVKVADLPEFIIADIPEPIVLSQPAEAFVAEEEPNPYDQVRILPLIIDPQVLRAYENEPVDAVKVADLPDFSNAQFVPPVNADDVEAPQPIIFAEDTAFYQPQWNDPMLR